MRRFYLHIKYIFYSGNVENYFKKMGDYKQRYS